MLVQANDSVSGPEPNSFSTPTSPPQTWYLSPSLGKGNPMKTDVSARSCLPHHATLVPLDHLEGGSNCQFDVSISLEALYSAKVNNNTTNSLHDLIC